MIGLAGHDPINRGQQLAAHTVDQGLEIGVTAQRVIRDMDAGKMIGDAARPHHVVFRLNHRIRARRYDAKFHPPAKRVRHLVPPSWALCD
jgi:hypothetical protein